MWIGFDNRILGDSNGLRHTRQPRRIIRVSTCLGLIRDDWRLSPRHHSFRVTQDRNHPPRAVFRLGDDVACLCIGANAGVCTDARDGANGAGSCSHRSRTAAAVQLEEKRALVAAAFAPGAVVSEVARQADVCASLIYRWRRELEAPGGFAEVIVAPMIDGRGGDGGDDLRCLPALPPVEAARPCRRRCSPRRRSRSSSPARRGFAFRHRCRRTWRRR